MKRILLVAALLLISNAGAFAAGNLEDSPDVADLIYDQGSGDVKLQPASGKKIVGFTIGNAAGQLKPSSADAFTNATPWGDVVYDLKATQIGSTDTSFAGTSSVFDLGPIIPSGFDAEGLKAFLSLANYSHGLGHKGVLDLKVIPTTPEPASAVLALMGMVGLASFRRRRA